MVTEWTKVFTDDRDLDIETDIHNWKTDTEIVSVRLGVVWGATFYKGTDGFIFDVYVKSFDFDLEVEDINTGKISTLNLQDITDETWDFRVEFNDDFEIGSEIEPVDAEVWVNSKKLWLYF